MADEDDLWMITAVIQPFKLDAVVLALHGLDDPVGMTVSDCRGFGRSRSPSTPRSADTPTITADDVVDFSAKTRIEIALEGSERAARVARVIAAAAHTGRKGDGKVFVSRITDAIRVKTGDVGRNAL